MTNTARFPHCNAAHVEPSADTCGRIRPLIGESDGAAAKVRHLEIMDAKPLYPQRTDEVYSIFRGMGTRRLDSATFVLEPGAVAYVPRGVNHKARGQLELLVVRTPRGVLHNVHEPKQGKPRLTRRRAC